MAIEFRQDYSYCLLVPTSMGCRITPLGGQPEPSPGGALLSDRTLLGEGSGPVPILEVKMGPQDGLIELFEPGVLGADLPMVREGAGVVSGHMRHQSQHVMASG